MLLGWVIVVLALTLASGGADEGRSKTAGGASDVVVNVALFVPVGALALAAAPNRRRLVAASGPLLSVAVELYQAGFLPARYPSARDVITNSAGHVIGMGIAAIILRD